jgi:hypothetical protein
MTFDYARARATAARLIASFGQTVTLRKPGATAGPSYDPVPGAPDDYTAKAVDLNRLIRNMNDVTVTAVSRTLFLDASVSPAKGDQVQIGSEWCEITVSRPLAPGGVNVLYEVEVSV